MASMDDVAASTLATLKKQSASAEAKIAAINSLKSSIKHQRIPETAQATTLECLRLAIASQVSSSLVITGFSGLGHLVKRLNLQDQTAALFSQRTNLLGILSDKLGDAKEPQRAAASQILCDLWTARSSDVERVVRESAIQGSSVRAKTVGMQWVRKMHEEQQLQFRSFVPALVECLEDADGTVRDAAKENIVELFRTARDAAKADLKRQLVAHNVRKSITEHILSQLQIPAPKEPAFHASVHASTRPETPHHDQRLPDAPQEPSLPPSAEVQHIDPLYVHAHRELEDLFRAMHPCFEDKEKEDNWKLRDNNVLKIRRLLKGNAPEDYHELLVTSLKSLLEGFLKVANSLRTTMSTNGCQLLQEMCRTLGTAVDPMVEILLRGIEKMPASTKNIAAQNGNTTVDTVLANASYNVRLMQFIHAAAGDKNVQPRQFASNWLKTVLRRQVHNRSYFDHSGGLELADKSIRKGLADANPKVREMMRSTYWLFAQTWPDRAESIMLSLDAKSKQLLEKDPSNPNASNATFTRSVGPDSSTNPRAPSNARATLKDTIAARRNAAQKLPDRPGSAMATFTPSRQGPQSASRGTVKSGASSQRVPSGAPSHTSTKSAVSTVSSTSSTSTGQGSLMSAPMRRPKRAEMPRPVTADPYAGRNALREDTPPRSPITSPHPASKASVSSKSSAHVKSKSTTTLLGSNAASTTSSRGGSPKTSPVKAQPQPNKPSHSASLAPSNLRADNGMHSPSVRDDNFTMVFPHGKMAPRTLAGTRVRNNENDRPGSGHFSQLGAIDEDNFTMIMPDKLKSSMQQPHTSTWEQQPIASIPSEPVDRKDDALMVYEDPAAEDIVVAKANDDPPTALEELHPSEQNSVQQPPPVLQPSAISPTASPPQQPRVEDQNRDRQRSASPSKKSIDSPTKRPTTPRASTTDSPLPDRAETLKTRRLLASGTERVRDCKLDAHGFRRLQDLIKYSVQNPDLSFAPLLRALIGFLQKPAADATNVKEKALRHQALSCVRAIVSLYSSRDADVKTALPLVLVGLSQASGTSDGSSTIELEKAGDEIVKRIAILHDPSTLAFCIDAVANFVGENASLTPAVHDEANPTSKTQIQQHSKATSTTLALSILSRLTALYSRSATSEQHPDIYSTIRTRLAAFAVRCLAHLNPDVRRKGVEFAVELYGLFPSETAHNGMEDNAGGEEGEQQQRRVENGKMEFWRLLKPAGEQSCNLLAYYLARSGRVGGAA